jgi:asparagine N-glycosylation enzyme membrane subunit Stt3
MNMRISKRLKHYSILIGGLFAIFSTVVNFTDNLLKFHYIENLYGTDPYYNYGQSTVTAINHETNLDAVVMIFIIVLT